jgi:hypothetical protein
MLDSNIFETVSRGALSFLGADVVVMFCLQGVDLGAAADGP